MAKAMLKLRSYALGGQLLAFLDPLLLLGIAFQRGLLGFSVELLLLKLAPLGGLEARIGHGSGGCTNQSARDMHGR